VPCLLKYSANRPSNFKVNCSRYPSMDLRELKRLMRLKCSRLNIFCLLALLSII